jgi:hypothetical protein
MSLLCAAAGFDSDVGLHRKPKLTLHQAEETIAASTPTNPNLLWPGCST